MPKLYTATFETQDGRLVRRAEVECCDAFMLEVTADHIEYRRRRNYSKMFEPKGQENMVVSFEEGVRLFALSRMFTVEKDAYAWLKEKLVAHINELRMAAFAAEDFLSPAPVSLTAAMVDHMDPDDMGYDRVKAAIAELQNDIECRWRMPVSDYDPDLHDSDISWLGRLEAWIAKRDV